MVGSAKTIALANQTIDQNESGKGQIVFFDMMRKPKITGYDDSTGNQHLFEITASATEIAPYDLVNIRAMFTVDGSGSKYNQPEFMLMAAPDTYDAPYSATLLCSATLLPEDNHVCEFDIWMNWSGDRFGPSASISGVGRYGQQADSTPSMWWNPKWEIGFRLQDHVSPYADNGVGFAALLNYTSSVGPQNATASLRQFSVTVFRPTGSAG